MATDCTELTIQLNNDVLLMLARLASEQRCTLEYMASNMVACAAVKLCRDEEERNAGEDELW